MKGTIIKLVKDKGFGFADVPGHPEYFLHRSAFAPGAFELLFEGQAVEFEPADSNKGKRALNVVVLD